MFLIDLTKCHAVFCKLYSAVLIRNNSILQTTNFTVEFSLLFDVFPKHIECSVDCVIAACNRSVKSLNQFSLGGKDLSYGVIIC
ncbi:MAG: hypothetical protein B7Y36_11295 [Novosphingobium sp. 28-62-57]|nr:MAG: hypothetical protein B7Z34_03540 [Novosphingobium sp. 12-62-10]OYZ09961.1 MAG: hypothetical protein B7Y36_11295 [Novosphingobium sp. 28-62-57]